MRGIESIVGAYLALIIVIGTVAGLYIWSKNSTLYLKENIDTASIRLQHILYPPVLSLNYSETGSLLLTIQPRIPIQVKEIIVRDLNGDLLHYESLNVFINSSYTVRVPVAEEPFLILVVSGENVVYYYNPREDPNLANAPEYIKSKNYVDSELISYLANNHNSTSKPAVAVLTDHGYKLHAGTVSTTLYSQPEFREFLFLNGPVDCNSVKIQVSTATYYDLPCNCNLSSRFHWVTYGLYSRLSTNPYYQLTTPYYFVQSGNVLIIGLGLTGGTNPHNYFQVYRLLRYTGSDPVQINVTVKIRGYYISSRGDLQPAQLDFIPVVYLYDADTSPYNPVTLATGYWARGDFKLWTKRLPLETTYVTVNSVEFWSKTYTVTVNPLEIGVKSLLILVGLEIINTSGRAVYIEIEISVESI